MELIISSSDTLETIKQKSTCPIFLQNVLESTTNLQNRCQNTLLSSLRAKTKFAEWIAALLVMNAKVHRIDGNSSPLKEVLLENSNALKELATLKITADENDFYGFEKVANTPSDHSIVSIFVHLKFSNLVIEQVDMVATGISSSAFETINCTDSLIGKKLDISLIQDSKQRILDEFNPPDSYLGTSQYKKEMAEVLFEKILLKKLNGEN